ncbi:MAG: hypothetical protein M0P21_11245 [Methanoculleus sp.]|jgi:hypothetical protein|nr:hypothetical protein [Methanoculleus sp.]
MSSKKEVTIGITINLENYENLRLEVEGDVETHEDVDDLITFLDGILSRLGRGDPATAERVDAYRRRVLAARPAVPEIPAPEKKAAEPAAPVTEPAPREEAETKACPPPEVIEAAIPPAPEPPAKPEENAPAQAPPVQESAKPSAAPAEDVCEMCGAEVTKSQAKLSRLFMNKTLCKKCMEQP